MTLTREEAIRFLTTDPETGEDTGGLLVPCSRWGRNGAECAEVAYDLYVTLVAAGCDDNGTDSLDSDMSLVVNDSDDVAYTLWSHGSAEVRERYATELADAGYGYVATVNTPGYMPWDDDPPIFADARSAWEYLADERERQEDSAEAWGDEDTTAAELRDMAEATPGEGTVYGPTPGYDGDHDLGLAYCVTLVRD